MHKTSLNLDEFNFYKDQLSKFDLGLVDREIDELYQIHAEIWALESEIKSGVEHKLTLEEIGRRAIQIRNWKDRKSTRLNSSHVRTSRMPSSA